VTAEQTTFEVIIHVLNPIVAPDFFQMIWTAGPSSFFRILGENTATLHAGTLDVAGGFSPHNPSAPLGGAATIIKDTTSGVVWAGLISKRIHFPAVDSWAYVLKDLGGGSARISVPQFSDEPGFNPTPITTNPANGQAYVVDDPVHVVIGEVNLHNVSDPSSPLGAFSGVNLADITAFADPGTTVMDFERVPRNMGMVFYRCLLEGVYENTAGAESVFFSVSRAWALNEPSISQSPFGKMGFWGGALVRADGFPSYNNVSGGSGDAGVIDYLTCVQFGFVFIHGGSQVRSISVWDAPLAPLLDNPGGHALLVGSPGHHASAGVAMFTQRSGPIYGNGNAGVGVAVGPSSSAIYEILPNITGAGGNFKLGTGGKARFFNEGTGVYSPVIAETWANLAAAQPAGFGSNAHDLTENSHMLLLIP
jgi:hypothetical protein